MEENKEVLNDSRTNMLKEVQDKLLQSLAEGTVKQLLENNFAEFDYKDVKYKVRKPTFQERQEVYKKRCDYQIQLLKEKNTEGSFKNLNEKDLKQLYKERGIDIDEIGTKIVTLTLQERLLLEKLGAALKEQAEDKQLKLYRDEIEQIRTEIVRLSVEKASLLEFSIENQVLIFLYSYFTMLITEKKMNDTWVKCWNNLDEYYKSDEELINTASTLATLILNEPNK